MEDRAKREESISSLLTRRLRLQEPPPRVAWWCVTVVPATDFDVGGGVGG